MIFCHIFICKTSTAFTSLWTNINRPLLTILGFHANTVGETETRKHLWRWRKGFLRRRSTQTKPAPRVHLSVTSSLNTRLPKLSGWFGKWNALIQFKKGLITPAAPTHWHERITILRWLTLVCLIVWKDPRIQNLQLCECLSSDSRQPVIDHTDVEQLSVCFFSTITSFGGLTINF